MDFGLTEAQRDVQELARRLFSEQVTTESLAAYDEFRQPRFDPALHTLVAEAGLFGIAVAEEQGGLGLGLTELALMIEEAGRSLAPLPLIPHLVSAALPLQQFGSPAQRERWLPGVVDGSLLLSAALTEPDSEDPLRPASQAVRSGLGYRVSGIKTAVPHADQAARVLLAAESGRGVVVMLVDPQAPGVTLRPMQTTHFEPQFEMALQDVVVEADDVLVKPERGAAAMAWVAERTMAALCAHQLGVADAALAMTARYTAERQQFGVPIATFQAVGHRAADAYIDIECLRLTTAQAIALLSRGQEATTEVTIAKIQAGDCGHRVSYAAQHLHGGTGIDRDYPLWRYCLFLRYNELALGGSAIHLAELGERIAAGQADCA